MPILPEPSFQWVFLVFSKNPYCCFFYLPKPGPKVSAAEFSFLLAIPAIAGATVFKFAEMSEVDGSLTGQYLAGSITAFILGLAAVYAVLTTIRKGKFQYFGYYCLAIGLLGLLYFSFVSP